MLKVYNTLTNKKEKFVPFQEGKVRMYVCGLTVQNYSHLGHIRSAINYDVIRRYLEYKGYDVIYVQNFTDINEKIVEKAAEEGLSPGELADKYRKAYLEDIENMNIKKADIYCSATEHIKEIQEMIQTLIDKSFAYEVRGSVYFSVEKFSDYGKLSGRKLEEMEAGSRVAVSKDKKHPLDFALWKKVEDEEVSWDSPWGKGWPGWHIECSAMSMKYLENRFDIHGGGTDLIFPHHENEIAQSEAYSGEKPFVKYWLHNGTIDIKGEKMSKSLGNFFTTRELLKKFSPDVIRYYVLTKHYRSPIEFSLDKIEEARVSLERVLNTREKLQDLRAENINNESDYDYYAVKLEDPRAGNINNRSNHSQYDRFAEKLGEKRSEFEKAMDDDFNSARAIGVFHDFVTEINKLINSSDFKLNEKTRLLLAKADKLFTDLTVILGLKLDYRVDKKADMQLVNDLVEYLLEIREKARENKNYVTADRIRDDLQEMGIIVKDTPGGVEWSIKRNDMHGS